MVTKGQVYQIALDALNNVWTRLSSSADDWKANPKLRLSIATTPVQTAINGAVKDISQGAGALGREDKQAKNLLEDIAARLEAFKAELSRTGEIRNATELVEVWKRAVQSIIDDVLSVAPEVESTATYVKLMRRLAA